MEKTLPVAILDMNQNQPNRGIGGIQRRLVEAQALLRQQGLNVRFEPRVFEVRDRLELPWPGNWPLVVSSGGPGDPNDGEGSSWETCLFEQWRGQLERNAKLPASERVAWFSICHSFQLLFRCFELGRVTRAATTSRGLVRLAATDHAAAIPGFSGLSPEFRSLDNREWEVSDLAPDRLTALGGRMLAWYAAPGTHGRTAAAVALSDEFIGCQFHPEADRTTIQEAFGAESFDTQEPHLPFAERLLLDFLVAQARRLVN